MILQRTCVGVRASAALLVLALASPVVHAQEDPQEAPPGPPILMAEELVMRPVRPVHTPADGLFELVWELHGRSFLTRNSTAETPRRVTNLVPLPAGGFLINDTAENADRIAATVRTIDTPHGGSRPEDSLEGLEVLEYQPRYTSSRELREILSPFWRNLRQPGGSTVHNIAVMSERGLLVIRDTPERLAEIQAILARVDAPEEQILLVCMLVRGTHEAEGASSLSADLVRTLSATSSYERFEIESTSVLQLSATPGNQVSLMLEGATEHFQFNMTPYAYDSETGTLALVDCKFNRHKPQGQSGFHAPLFTTNLLLRAGRETVVGSTGRDPLFVVLRTTAL